MSRDSLTSNPTLKYLDRQILFRKIRLFLFYVPTTALAAFFLFASITYLTNTFNWNGPADRAMRYREIAPNDVQIGILLALALTTLNIFYLAFSTVRVVRAFRLNIWLDEERMDRIWLTLAFVFVAYLFAGGLMFCSWVNIDLSTLQ